MAENQIIDSQTLNLLGKEFVEVLAELLVNNGKRATGNLIKSLDERIQPAAQSILIGIEAEDYLENVDQGRRPGSFPPIRDIAKWARIKGISKDAVFPIAQSIFKFGIKPTNVINQTINQILNSPSLQKKYEEAIGADLEQLISELFNQEPN